MEIENSKQPVCKHFIMKRYTYKPFLTGYSTLIEKCIATVKISPHSLNEKEVSIPESILCLP